MHLQFRLGQFDLLFSRINKDPQPQEVVDLTNGDEGVEPLSKDNGA